MKIKIFAAAAAVGSVTFLAAAYTAGTTANTGVETAVSTVTHEPRTRCTRLSWPKASKQEIKDYKAGKLLGTRCRRMYGKRTAKILPNQPPAISGLMPIGAQGAADALWAVPASGTLAFTTTATDPDGDTMLYTYSVTGGRVTGDLGATAMWNLNGAAPGTYTITSEVDDGCGCIAFESATAEVKPL